MNSTITSNFGQVNKFNLNKSFDLHIEKFQQPYMFVVDKNLKISNVYLIKKSNQMHVGEYLKLIKKKYFQGKTVQSTYNKPFSIQLPKDLFKDVDDHMLAYSVQLTDKEELPEWIKFNAETLILNGEWKDKKHQSLIITAIDGYKNKTSIKIAVKQGFQLEHQLQKIYTAEIRSVSIRFSANISNPVLT